MNFQVKHKRFIDNGGSMPLHGPRPVLEYAVSEIMSFSFDFDLAPETRYTLSGDTEPLRSGEPMFLAEGTLLEGRSLRFEVNTLTRSFHDKCRNFHQKLHLEIAAKSTDGERLLLQDWIECSPRINVSETPPEPLGDYYTAAEIDAKFAALPEGNQPPDLSEYAKKTDLPGKISQLENDSGFLTDAPADGTAYARRNSQWTALVDTEENYSTVEKTKLASLPTAAELDQRFEEAATGGVDLSLYYTGEKIDALLAEKPDASDIPDAYTKAETDALLAGKPDASDIPDAYTKAETDALLAGKPDASDIPDAYTKAETDALLAEKPDASDIPDAYTRSEIDAMFGTFETAAAAIIGETTV